MTAGEYQHSGVGQSHLDLQEAVSVFSSYQLWR